MIEKQLHNVGLCTWSVDHRVTRVVDYNGCFVKVPTVIKRFLNRIHICAPLLEPGACLVRLKLLSHAGTALENEPVCPSLAFKRDGEWLAGVYRFLL